MHFAFKPDSAFNPLITHLAMHRINAQDHVGNTYYELYEAETGSGTLNRQLSVIVFYGSAGKGLDYAFPGPVLNWLTVQAALFINY